MTLTEWVRCMSYDRSKEVGDLGSFFAVDEAGGVVRIVPHSVHDHDDRCAQHGSTANLAATWGACS